MASPVIGIVIMIGITFVSFGSLVVFATTNHYEKISCKNDGIFQGIYDTAECPDHKADSSAGNETAAPPSKIEANVGCTEMLYEGSNIWLCPIYAN